MSGAAVTTVYEIRTVYRNEYPDAGGLNRYGRSVGVVDRNLTSMKSSLAAVGGGFGRMARYLGPITGGLIGMYGAVALGRATFSNLNAEMNTTITLGAQLNQAFNFKGATNGIENFNLGMKVADRMFRDLVRDAAALPGELSDFRNMMTLVSGSTFAAGGSTGMVRGLISNLALTRAATGSDFPSVGLGAMQMLQGSARVTNPLFRFMSSTGLLGQSMGAENFNALPAERRLGLLSKGLETFAGNAEYAARVLNTWDTQVGTFKDSLVGVEGVMGKLGRNAFDGFLLSLTDLNNWLKNNSDMLVERTKLVTGMRLAPMSEKDLRDFTGKGPYGPGMGFWNEFFEYRKEGRIANERRHFSLYRAQNLYHRELMSGGTPWDQAKNWSQRVALAEGNVGPLSGERDRRFAEIYQEALLEHDRRFMGKASQEEPLGTPKAPVTNAKIEQNFHIKLDLKSDDAPEAIAVKLEKAIAKAAVAPTTTGRILTPKPTPTGP